MIAQGVDLKSVEINGNSPFMLSFLAEREDYLKMLILNHQHLENIHPTDSEILPALVSVFGRSPEILEPINILLNQGANINAQTRQGDTAIILAGWLTDNIDLIKLLVKRGADVNIPNVNGDTPLIDAAYKGKNDILKILLDNGADITVKNNSGLSALDMARKTENTDAIEMLEEKSETKK